MTKPQSLAPHTVETARTELFLLVARAIADPRARHATDRFALLAARLAAADEDWTARLCRWTGRLPALRRLRLALVAELAYARAGGTRRFVARSLTRADEPGELLDYWLRRFGRALPQPVKRGVADAAVRLYDELALATHDSPGAPLRFADVLALTHPSPRDRVQAAVFAHAVGRRRGTTGEIPEELPILRARRALYWVPAARRPHLLETPEAAHRLAGAAMPWPTVERWLLGSMTAAAWQVVLPGMPYRDRLAHLRDFDRLGVPSAHLADELAEPAQVVTSGVTPLEVVAALHAPPGSRWTWALRQAAQMSLAAVPALPGRTLVVVDRTTVMAGPAWPGALLTRGAAAAVFAAALTARAGSADLVAFGTAPARLPVKPGEPLLTTLGRFAPLEGDAEPDRVIREHFDGHDRLVVLTHPDRAGAVADAVTAPAQEHVITQVSAGWFAALPYIEMARTADWPF
ncbi:hypothetical protein [Nonomuraea typhae]|uniref:TROVE domain-containing protein n=1 Tax=Nonomuraea typhae TaxID=2603600 RepID=A0ABW7YUL4_9ACTN